MKEVRKLQILVFIDWFLPGTASGGPVRSYANMMEHMKEEVDFFVVTRNHDYCDNRPYQNILKNQWNNLFANVKVMYVEEKEISSKTFRKVLDFEKFDAIYINGVYSWKFSILPILALRSFKLPLIISARGMLNPQAFSVKGLKKKIYIKLSRLLGLYKDVYFHATNEDEKSNIYEHFGKSERIKVAPNFPRKIEYFERSGPKLIGVLNLINVARISKEKGTLVILKILSKVSEGKVSLDIYGPIYDHRYWDLCKEAIASLPHNIVVNYKGILNSEKVPKKMSEYDAFIMPSYGENFGHSILEAMSVGLPVIISNLTPWNSLNEKNVGWDIGIENLEGFVKSINQLLFIDDTAYKEKSLAARQYAAQFINNPSTLQANKKMFEEVINDFASH
ncbi:glycosyltransferase family 4 protein [Aegicerativicinus sediminis]|uniref:glycosyltransferase family 4 protein n=1 Tax=Aegicerativicinus sediminis TaxID=2893202 RepID=UPI001E4C55EE|nr:glycosyltransferase family 4 protein [Aegicerativicinus sediminis]